MNPFDVCFSSLGPRSIFILCSIFFSQPITRDNQTTVTRGQGNAVSVEYNLFYRWHAVIAKEDISWTEYMFSRHIEANLDTTITAQDIHVAFRNVFVPPAERSFGMKHERDDKFSDDRLADILQRATEKTAGAFRARGTSPTLKLLEIIAINQARDWGVCTMNKFRQSLGLKQYASFEEWNSGTPGVAEAARKLYGDINNLELYVGLQAEDCMPLGPGSDLCCGYTMMRAVLASSVSLARGDRYYTTDYTREFLFIASTRCFEDLNFFIFVSFVSSQPPTSRHGVMLTALATPIMVHSAPPFPSSSCATSRNTTPQTMSIRSSCSSRLNLRHRSSTISA